MEKSSATSPTKNSGPAAVRTPSPPAGWRPQAHPPRRSAPNGCAGTWVVPGVGSSKRREVVTPLAKLRGAILRFGPSAVKSPGRTHDNHCVTKGLKVSLKPFQRLGVAHVGRSPRPEDPKGQSPVRAAGPGRRPGRPPPGGPSDAVPPCVGKYPQSDHSLPGAVG